MINAQALLGTMLGTYTLQKLVGQGCSSAVFLAQQAQQERLVAVKVLWPAPSATTQVASQRSMFLERFRQEVAAVTLLQHESILPVLEYGEHKGQAYLVTPYASGGSLKSLMEHEGQLALTKAATYLDQLASALDYAHERGFVHRNCKPCNVLLKPEGHILLADFGLMKIVAERQTSQMRLLKASTSLEALAYLAPEQVMGDVIDARTDIYALGAILYHMVTGKTPFQAETPLQMATQLVQSSPSAPHLLRADIPGAAEQVVLRAMAKRSQDRYACAEDFANAFRVALTVAGSLPESSTSEKPGGGNAAATPLATPRPRSLFDPVWQKTERKSVTGYGMEKAVRADEVKPTTTRLVPATDTTMAAPPANIEKKVQATGLLSSMRKVSLSAPEESNPNEFPTRSVMPPAPRPRLGGKTSLLRAEAGAEASARVTTKLPDPMSPLPATNVTAGFSTPLSSATSDVMLPPQPRLATPTNLSDVMLPPQPRLATPINLSDPGMASTNAIATAKHPISQPTLPSQTTGALMVPTSEQGNTGTYTLTGAVKVVQVPVAGQPGRYVTGLLPVLTPPPQTQTAEEPHVSLVGSDARSKKSLFTRSQKVLALLVLVVVVLSGSGIFWFFHAQSHLPVKSSVPVKHLTPNVQASLAAQATATAAANTILIDPLTQNIHNWPVVTSGYKQYVFEGGAYHITDNDAQQSAPAILAGVVLNEPLAYSLTMDEIQGNDNSVNNSFGMILRLNSHTVGSKNIVTFYCFEVVNTRGGQYQFWKYDNSKGAAVNPWKSVWQHTFGKEFRQGQGPKNTNTIKVFADGSAFTFTVNGKEVGTTHDSALSSGEIGMLVNLKGTEVAFSNLLLTRS